MKTKMITTPVRSTFLKKTDSYNKNPSFRIAGIGGSAGGLEAFQELLQNLSDSPGMAFVFIMHLAPKIKSMLTELLARQTKMPVHEIKNKMEIKINNVYVIPPGMNISVLKRRLFLSKQTDPKHMPINTFFDSLAKEEKDKSIGIILSGTAEDGSKGAEAIKAEGGIVFAQDQKSAKFTDMPGNAVKAGWVDFILSPKKIAYELERMAKHPHHSFTIRTKSAETDVTYNKDFKKILDLLRLEKKLDFTFYKMPTIKRRIFRRMQMLREKSISNYAKYLRGHKNELDGLYEDLLINVTEFFREPRVFEELKRKILPAIIKTKKKDQAIRVWIPACSTGEEVYSYAICIFEMLGKKPGAFHVQIFATDVSESSVSKARTGIYGKNIKDHISPERLKRFFSREGDNYRVSKQIREMCVFSIQNIFSDPPFSNVDLVSCRNLLIYLEPVLQKKVFRNIYYALTAGGFLVLGKSEFTGSYSNGFRVLDRKNRIFVKKHMSSGLKIKFEPEFTIPEKLQIIKRNDLKETVEIDSRRIESLEEKVNRIVLKVYAESGVFLNSEMEVVLFRGFTGRYLESGSGKPSMNIFKLARKGIFVPLRSAIYKAKETKHTVRTSADRVKLNGHIIRVNITVIPVKTVTSKEIEYMVIFDEINKMSPEKILPKTRKKTVKEEGQIESLERELSEMKEYTRVVTAEQEKVKEEMKIASEEVLSGNEELQSTNEELETSKEELQSSNEELITSNEELQNRNAEVALLNNDLVNLLSSIDIPVVMIGADFVIRRITPQCGEALNIIPADIGRGITGIRLKVEIPDLKGIISSVMKALHTKTLEIKSSEGKWYSVFIKPYRTFENKIDGVVLIFIDITASKKAQQIISEARGYAENIVETIQESLIVLDTDLKVISANKMFYRTFKVNLKETKGRFIYDLGNRQWDIPKLRHLLENFILKGKSFKEYEIEHDFESIGKKVMLLSGQRLASSKLILISIVDITERKRLQVELKSSHENLDIKVKERSAELVRANLLSGIGVFAATIAHELRNPLAAIKVGMYNIRKKINDTAIDSNIDNINKKIDESNQIINNLLFYVRIHEPHYEKVNIDEIIEESVGVAERRYDKKTVKIVKNIKTRDVIIDADPLQIKEVFNNLLNNAFDALPAEKGMIKVEVKLNDTNFIKITFADNGTGIEKDILEKIFDAFFTTKAKGTGLGLSVCKYIAEIHHGSLTVESKVGKGTVFTMTLPLKREESEKSQ